MDADDGHVLFVLALEDRRNPVRDAILRDDVFHCPAQPTTETRATRTTIRVIGRSERERYVFLPDCIWRFVRAGYNRECWLGFFQPRLRLLQAWLIRGACEWGCARLHKWRVFLLQFAASNRLCVSWEIRRASSLCVF